MLCGWWQPQSRALILYNMMLKCFSPSLQLVSNRRLAWWRGQRSRHTRWRWSCIGWCWGAGPSLGCCLALCSVAARLAAARTTLHTAPTTFKSSRPTIRLCRRTVSDAISCYVSRQTLTSPSSDSVLCLMKTAYARSLSDTIHCLMVTSKYVCRLAVPNSGSGSWHMNMQVRLQCNVHRWDGEVK